MEIMGVNRQQLTDPNGLVSAVYRDGTSHEKKNKNSWNLEMLAWKKETPYAKNFSFVLNHIWRFPS